MKKRDRTFLFILKTIIFNNRLKTYEKYIRYAIKNGYQVMSLKDFYSNYKNIGKCLVLRHDVDHVGESTRKMYEIEKKIGVKSTYYFRGCTLDVELAKEMHSFDYDVGFHFETLSDYADEHNLNNVENINKNEMVKTLRKEICAFEKKVGFSIDSICSHGTATNLKIGHSNNWILDDKELDDSWGGCRFEAYNKKMYDFVDTHIMDCDLLFNYGFAYKDNPYCAIENCSNHIIFLAHPSHWYLPFNKRMRQLARLLIGRGQFSTDRIFERVS